MTPLIIAVWFCDDGGMSYNKKDKTWISVKFATDSFSKNDIRFLSRLLSERYDEYFGVYKHEKGFVIKAATDACNKIAKDIDKVLPNYMNRKALWRNR